MLRVYALTKVYTQKHMLLLGMQVGSSAHIRTYQKESKRAAFCGFWSGCALTADNAKAKNAEKVTHTKEILLYQTMILYNCVPI